MCLTSLTWVVHSKTPLYNAFVYLRCMPPLIWVIYVNTPKPPYISCIWYLYGVQSQHVSILSCFFCIWYFLRWFKLTHSISFTYRVCHPLNEWHKSIHFNTLCVSPIFSTYYVGYSKSTYPNVFIYFVSDIPRWFKSTRSETLVCHICPTPSYMSI